MIPIWLVPIPRSRTVNSSRRTQRAAGGGRGLLPAATGKASTTRCRVVPQKEAEEPAVESPKGTGPCDQEHEAQDRQTGAKAEALERSQECP